jgi:hypothetical protein
MIDNLYRNATTKIKWKGEFSEGFKIEQGVRRGFYTERIVGLIRNFMMVSTIFDNIGVIVIPL